MDYLENADALTKKVKKIVMPNVLQFVGMLGLLLIGTIFVIPSIQDVFDSMGSKDSLPWITQAFAAFLKSAANWWFYPVILIGIAIGGVIAYIRTPQGRYQWHLFKYNLMHLQEIQIILQLLSYLHILLGICLSNIP